MKIKGLQTLVPVFRRYEKAQLWIVGVGDYEPVLRRMAEKSPNIKFLGYQSGEQLRILYKQALATIVFSLWYEVFGLVILEAFSHDTPVIVRNRGAMPKIIEANGGGFVFDTDKELLVSLLHLRRHCRAMPAFICNWSYITGKIPGNLLICRMMCSWA